MDGRKSWHGTAVQLMAELSIRDKAEAKPTTWRSWPANASAFGKKLASATPTLRKLGVGVTKKKARDRKSSRLISLTALNVSDVSFPSDADTTDSTDTSDSKIIVVREGCSMTLAEINRMIRAAIRAARQEGVSEVQVTIADATVRISLSPDVPDKQVAEGQEIVL